jgi:hypothetical protein
MNILPTIIIYGIPCSLILSLVILAMLWYNPRLLLKQEKAVALAKTCRSHCFFLVTGEKA